MKVVQINAVYQYSSTGRNVKEMHFFLQKKGVGSFVFCTNYKEESNQIYKIGSLFDYKLHAFLSRVMGLQGYFSFFATKKCIKRLKEISPNVVVLNNLHANYVNLPMLLKYLAKYDIPTVLVLHDCWFFTGHCCHYTEDQCYKWQTECHHCPILHKYNKSLFFNHSRRIFKDKQRLFGQIKRLAIIGVSDWITNEARKSLLKKAKTIHRIYNWIDLEIFKPVPADDLRRQLKIAADQFVILGVAQGWSEKKGLSLFVSVAEHFPECKVVLVGTIPNEYTLLVNMITVGTVNDVYLLAKYYSMVNVFLNPSIQETFGKVSAEALACGTPVIANDATANPEIVGDCGFVVHNNSKQEIYTAIHQIQETGKKYYTTMCVKRAAELFNRETNLREYLQVYKDLSD